MVQAMSEEGAAGTGRDGLNRSVDTRAGARAYGEERAKASLPVPVSLSNRARHLARELSRLSPDWRNPERYFENRSEIEHALRRLAQQLERTR